MSLMQGRTYDALIEAGASHEKAQAAAEELAGYDKELADIKGTLKMHSALLAYLSAAITAVLLRVFLA